MTWERSLRVLLIAPLRFAISPPHAGGLEAAVWSEAHALTRRGHDVTLVGVRGSDFTPPGSIFEVPALEWPAEVDGTDSTYPPAYESRSVPALARILQWVADHPERFDVVSNHALHPLPLVAAPALGVPMVTTLHTPVDDGFVRAHTAARGAGSTFLAVSDHTRQSWARAGVPSERLHNGVDPEVWTLGPGGDDLVWFGRIVPEKAPHLAVRAARLAGRPITFAGRIGDRRYAESEFLPLLGPDVTYVGPLAPTELAALVGRSAAALATPAWAEPFGLVAPEALLCGTPVIGFSVGGVPEIAAQATGMHLVPAGDVEAMAAQVDAVVGRTSRDPQARVRIRERAAMRFSLENRIDALEEVLRSVAFGDVHATGRIA